MLRTFSTHEIRRQRELSSCLWEFTTLPEDGSQPKALRVVVPSCWENYPDTRTYRGKACYEREFQASGNIRLEFKGVSHTAEVFVDGRKAAEHYNAYTPFSAVIRELAPGKHRLKVLVDNSFGSQSALHVENDYQTYGGITRAVALEELGEAYLTSLQVTPVKRQGRWYARVQAGVRNLGAEPFRGLVRFRIGRAGEGEAGADLSPKETREENAAGYSAEAPENAAGCQFEAQEKLKAEYPAEAPESAPACPLELVGEVETLLSAELCCAEAEEWNPETPNLYTICAVLENEAGEAVDDLIDRFGFREVRTEGKDILLNGKKLRIRGFSADKCQWGSNA